MQIHQSETAAPRCALATLETNILRWKWHCAALRFVVALRRHDRALKYGFNPDQPRIPSGNPGGGQWTGGGAPSQTIRLAGEVPTGDSPEFPKERPPTSSLRSAALKVAARLLARFGGPIGTVIEAGSWAYRYSPFVQSYNDPPKTLEELQRSVSQPELGYDIHHVVERTQAGREGFTQEQIDNPNNLVRIPTMKHWEINAWYQTANPDFEGMTPREYLSGRSWSVRRAVGIDALKIHGVLKP
jgi:hypothetical protein